MGSFVQKKGAKAPSFSNKVSAYSVVGEGDNAKWDGRKKAQKVASVGGGGSDVVVILHDAVFHNNSLSCFYIRAGSRNQG